MGAPASPGAVIGGVLVAAAVSLVAAVVGIFIHAHTPTPCECPGTAADALDASRCKVIPLYMKVPLIATHLLAFILMPVSMWVCQRGAGVLQQLGMKSPVQAVLGLAYIMLSIAGEVGWHIHQRWFYHEDYDVLNFFFYAFITLGTSVWALGARKEGSESSILDAMLVLCTPLTALTYAWGAYASSNHLSGASKVPIYIIMTYEYGLLSYRLFKLLNNNLHVFLFPFFSVVVNLFFVFCLTQAQANVILNPLFHILHDAAGTELGVLIITLIIWNATSTDDKKRA